MIKEVKYVVLNIFKIRLKLLTN